MTISIISTLNDFISIHECSPSFLSLMIGLSQMFAKGAAIIIVFPL